MSEPNDAVDILVGRGESLTISCCDCGLSHDFSFDIKLNSVGLKIDINRRWTKKQRKEMIRKDKGIFGSPERYAAYAKMLERSQPVIKMIKKEVREK